MKSDDRVRREPLPGSQPGAPMPPGWINVKDFGAVGDGRHDDTEALQRAVDSAWVEGDFPPQHYNARFGPGPGPAGKNRYWSGTVYLPTGVYRTTRPLQLHAFCAIAGEATTRPVIVSSGKAALISGEGPWDEKDIDWESSGKWHTGADREHDETGAKYCCNVRLENLDVRGEEYGLHTLQVHTSHLLVKNCRLVGSRAGFVSTGFIMFSRFENSTFVPAMWFIEKVGNVGPRFNISVIRDCEINSWGHQQSGEEWGLILKGCCQSIKIENLCLESAVKGILLDADVRGVMVSMDGIWNFDAHGDGEPPHLLHVKAAKGLSVANVMALDRPSRITLEQGNVSQILLQNILAEDIDAGGVKVTALNCCPVRNPGAGSVIDGQRVSETVIPTA